MRFSQTKKKEKLNITKLLKEKKNIVAVTSGTHWDRAWYLPFEQFRIKLVDVMNHLLNVFKKKKNFKKFVLDGQTIIIEDYLEIMPHKKSEIKKLIQNGQLVVGPFYILPDEYLVSGESMIRNILIGQKIAEDYGQSMNTGYIPDPFGHFSQLPQILNGFGIDSFIFMRGMGEEGEKLGTEFIWVAPDKKNKILAVHLICEYANAVGLGITDKRALFESERVSTAKADLNQAVIRAKKIIQDLKMHSNSKVLLFVNNHDHHFAQEDIGDVIDHLNKEIKDTHFIHCSFEDYINYLKESNPKMKEYEGELHKGKYFYLLSGVYSARMYLKMANEKCQRLTERYLEPLSSFAYLGGHHYPQEMIEYVWKLLLQNHPHDEICGCSVDATHRDMDNRFDRVKQVCDVLIEKAKKNISKRIKTNLENDSLPFVVFNMLNWERNAFVKCNLHIPYKITKKMRENELTLFDNNGKILPSKIKKADIFYDDVAYGSEKMQSITVETIAKLPSYGYKTLFIKKQKSKAPSTDLKITPNGSENTYLRFNINNNGTIDLYDKVSKAKYKKLHLFEDTEDGGDEYDYSPILNSETITSENTKAKITLYEKSDIRITYKVEIKLRIPKSLSTNRKNRSREKQLLNITTLVTLCSQHKWLNFQTEVFNNCKDHRLRLAFPTGLKTDYVFAESKFDVVKRSVIMPDKKEVEDWRQKPVPTKHQENFVDVYDGKNGLMFFNCGLPEYEAKKSTKGLTYYLTLFRSVGWLSRNDLLTRSNHAGPFYATPDAQCLQKMEFRYAICPHKGDYTTDNTFKLAYEFKNEPTVFLINQKDDAYVKRNDELPLAKSFISTDSDSIIISALKKAEKDNSLIIRCFNITNRSQAAIIHSDREMTKVYKSNLREENTKKLVIDKKNRFKDSIISKGITTYKVYFRNGNKG